MEQNFKEEEHTMRTDRMPSGLPRREFFPTNIIPEQILQPTERHIDNEAKSRMDDEGGSQIPPTDPPITTPSPAPSKTSQAAVPVTSANDSPATVAQADGC